MKILKLIVVLVVGANGLFAQPDLSTIMGTVTEAETGEPVLFGTVKLIKDGVFAAGAHTDFDGNYVLRGLEAGIYELEFSYAGFMDTRIVDVRLKTDERLKLDAQMEAAYIPCCCFIPSVPRPLIFNDGLSSETTFPLDRRGMIKD